MTFCHFWGQKNCIKKPLLSSQNVNLMLSNEYLRILIDVQINNYAVAPRCSCYQPLHCCRNSIWASVSLLLLYFQHWILRCSWRLDGSWVNDPSSEVPTNTGQPVEHEGWFTGPFAGIIWRCKYLLSSSEAGSEFLMGRMP